mgnify:CR=1 FL=1
MFRRWQRSIRIDDRVVGDSVLHALVEKPSRFAKRTIQQIYRTTFRNQRDEIVCEADSWCFRTERDTARERAKYAPVEVDDLARRFGPRPADEVTHVQEVKDRSVDVARIRALRVVEVLGQPAFPRRVLSGHYTLHDGNGKFLEHGEVVRRPAHDLEPDGVRDPEGRVVPALRARRDGHAGARGRTFRLGAHDASEREWMRFEEALDDDFSTPQAT